MIAVNPCEGCGVPVAPVVVSGPGCEQSFELDTGAAVPHYCRDYLAWHQPADRRDPHTVDVPHGWRPSRPAEQVRAA